MKGIRVEDFVGSIKIGASGELQVEKEDVDDGWGNKHLVFRKLNCFILEVELSSRKGFLTTRVLAFETRKSPFL